MSGAATGTGRLVRFILRRDRVRLTIWAAAVVALVVSSVASLLETFPTRQERQSRAELVENPAFQAFTGPSFGSDDYTYGSMTANEMFSFTALLVGVMSVLLVVRHTRAEEESGRAELLRATAIGRHSSTLAATVVLVLTNLVIGAAVAAGLAGTLTDEAVVSSVLFGAGLAAVGVATGAVALMLAQVTEYSRGATGLGLAALGVSYLLRAVGDISADSGQGPVSWLSPIGWAQATRMYVNDRWWPLLLPVALSVGAVAASLLLASRRDLGGGLVAQRPGPAHARAHLGSPVGLAVRLQRTTLLGWTAGLAVFGLVYGSVASEVEDFIEDNPTAAEIFQVEGADVSSEFFAAIVTFAGLLAVGFTLQATLRARSEEMAGRAEPLLATPLTRARWNGGHLAVAAAGAVVLLLVGGLALGGAAALATGDGGLVVELTGATLAYTPALWAMMGLAALLYGLSPRLALVSWAVLGYMAFVGTYGGLLGLPSWLEKLTPFGHTPRLPAEDLDVLPLVLLVVAAGGLVTLGQLALARRDLRTE